MAVQSAGSLVFSLHFLLHRLTGRNLLMGTLIKEATATEMNTPFQALTNKSDNENSLGKVSDDTLSDAQENKAE